MMTPREYAEVLGGLNQDVFDYQGCRFIGGTLWISFKDDAGKDDWLAMHQEKQGMSDFRLIRMESRCFSPSYSQAFACVQRLDSLSELSTSACLTGVRDYNHLSRR